jgi:hypothetical protein
MACGYISSNDNRLYVGLELNYGQVAAIDSRNRIPAVTLTARQQLERPERRDKTGTRTYPGTPVGLRKRTSFELRTYLTGWTRQDIEPSYGPLFQAAAGAAPALFAGGIAAESGNPKLLKFAAAHNLAEGQAVTFGGELRFVISAVDEVTVELNAPFTMAPGAGSPIGASVTYQPATMLDTVSVFDYYNPAGAVQRILNGAAIDRMAITVNGDYHEFAFRGIARDIIDSSSFAAGQGELTEFPVEPPAEQFDYTIIPGHLGQAWLGNTPDRFYTITAAAVTIENDVEPRTYEFGSDGPRCISPGLRTVTADLELFEMADAGTRQLYQAARQISPVGVMFQLGQQSGQLFGVYMKSVIPEVPEFDDGETRLRWKFTTCRAQGIGDDEIYLAFG